MRRKPRAVSSPKRPSPSNTKTRPTLSATASTALSNSSASLKSPRSRGIGGVSPPVSASSSSALRRASVERSRCRAAASSGSGDEPVSRATNCLDPARLSHLAPDLVDRLLDAVLEAPIRAAPHAFQQLRTGDHLARPTGKQLEHQQGTPLQLQKAIPQPRLAPRGINLEPAANHRASGRRVLPECSAYTREQHLAVGAFGDVVRRAPLDAKNLIARR